ncbi:LiaF transmembrane domain-containing protein [Actinoplanes sp. RD1]|uniref:LiaF transmembrane domain-containing protein n=1 Tax=Actinoplanes sp. RD1 TaxID=3064538 RepID=UPI0027426279|nr:hypothetical protein [Actinoplanes sp. RD1]
MSRGGRFFAAGLVLAGALLLLDRTVPAVDLTGTAARWWPVVLMVVGVVGVVRLLPAPDAMIGPLLLLLTGGAALILTVQPVPAWARPLLLPLLLLTAGVTLLLPGGGARSGNADGGLVRREYVLVARPVRWDPDKHPLLDVRTLAGGCVLTILRPPERLPEEPAPRLELKSALSGLDIIVPHGLKVHVDVRGWGARSQIDTAPTKADAADVTIVALSAFSSLRVRVAV